MEPSLRTFKGPHQAFPDWVCGDCEPREHVISFNPLLHVPFLHQSTPSFCWHIWTEVHLCCSCPFCVFTWTLFPRVGRTVAFTRWNTLQSGKAELSPLSQMQRSLSSEKSAHGTGWRMKISTSGPEHASSWRKLSSKSSRSTSDHVALHTRRTPYILLLRNVRYYLSVLCRKLCFVCYVMTATLCSLLCNGGVLATFLVFSVIHVWTWTYFRRYIISVFMFIITTVVSSFLALFFAVSNASAMFSKKRWQM